MTITTAEPAESLFNTLGAQYEDAFANDPLLCSFIKTVAEKLPANSKVLDVGCGTGKPVSHLLASAGHVVHGIDVSTEMVRLAGSQVPGGIFQQADMREYQPPYEMDGVFAILSLFQLTPGDLVSMMYKFAEWVRVGGFVALCVLPSTALAPQRVVYDPTWDAVWMIGKEWMGSLTNESFLSENGWERVLKEAGFVLEAEPMSYLFSPIGENHIPEAHHCLIARRVEKRPLLGPFPWPSGQMMTGVCSTDGSMMKEQRLVSTELEKLMLGLGQQNVFALGKNAKGSWLSATPGKVSNGEKELTETTGQVPISTLSCGEAETVLAPWTLSDTSQIEEHLSEIVRLAKSRIVLIQGAPDNETTRLINSVARSLPIGHQGQLLDSACAYLAHNGFSNISLQHVRASFDFPEEGLSERCNAAAEFLIGLWHQDHAQKKEMIEILGHRLQLFFTGHQHSIGFNMVALVATRLSD